MIDPSSVAHRAIPSFPSVPTSAALHQVLAASADLREFLEEFAQVMAAHLSSEGTSVWCAVTVLRDGRVGTVASSNARAEVLDEIQYDYGDGPCLTAARQQLLVHVPDLAAGPWPDYGQAAAAQGVRSAVAAPFDLPGPDKAALNVYAGTVDAFNEEAIAAITQEVVAASTALRLALRLARHQDTETDLVAAMSSRTAIDVAVGVLIAQQHCTQAEAFELLAAAAARRGVKVRDLAVELVKSITGEAPTTHFNTPNAPWAQQRPD
ncbi:GAF and ANTAR domain-containing protein [Kocuria oceani]|uniref:GAF and ANTAR domain-containing protein n=1 Tax=Kocuria oceani TaxID=988827 RepID=A0ABV9TPE9_9MICC|nr:GAF and ANTAR domain-containing protein [Kocuria oceani]